MNTIKPITNKAEFGLCAALLGILTGCTTYVEQMRATIRTTGGLAEDDVPAAVMDALVSAFRDWRSAEG